VWGYSNTSASRVVPKITAVFHGMVYAQAEALPVIVDAATGKDVPTPTPADGATPGATPTDGATPSETAPSDGTTPTTGSGNLGGWGDTSLLWGKPKSPAMVSQYGSVYLLDPGDKAPLGTETILVVQKAIA
jgi:hypothetical protein